MPLRLLLDEHLSPRVVAGVRAVRSTVVIESVQTWRDGVLRGASDDMLLREAHAEQWILVTYDQRTITPLIREWAEQGVPHGGVILVDKHTIDPSDFGGLVVALLHLHADRADEDWTDRVVYLARAR